MTTQIEAMKMMVDALESIRDGNAVIGQKEIAIAAGRAAIEAAENVEKIRKGLQPLVDSCKETRYRRDIKTAVDRFLCWKLPKDFAPDAGISFDKQYEYESYQWPIGTNLLTAPQAKAMFEHCLEGTGYVVHPNPPSAEIDRLEKVEPIGITEALQKPLDADWLNQTGTTYAKPKNILSNIQSLQANTETNYSTMESDAEIESLRKDAFDKGWIMAAQWVGEVHLLADMDSTAYIQERDIKLQEKQP